MEFPMNSSSGDILCEREISQEISQKTHEIIN